MCIAATVAVLLVGVVLSACGGGHAGSTGSSSGSAPADHNADDVTFARKMIPHHAQAIEMAQTAPSNTNNQPLVTLAYTIIETQTGEIQALREKLSRWSEDQSTGHDDHGGSARAGGSVLSARPAAGRGTRRQPLHGTFRVLPCGSHAQT